jgi:Flp pilus assembly protein TadB
VVALSEHLLLALLGGMLAGTGLLLLVVAFVGVPGRDPGRPPRFAALRRHPKQTTVMAMLGVGVGLTVLIVTRWLVLAVALGPLAGFWRQVFGGAAEERRAIARLDALASWTESMRDTIAGAVGLEQAIPATAATSAPVIRPALNLLVDRLRIREPLPTALVRFADDLDDASADLIVAALVLNARLRGPGLREVLGALAESAREELDMRRRVDATRRSTRRSVQIVIGVTLGVAALLVVLNRQYVEPYGSVVGQLVLAVSVALFAAGVLWLRRLARVQGPERFLSARGLGRLRPDLRPGALDAVSGGSVGGAVP